MRLDYFQECFASPESESESESESNKIYLLLNLS